MKTQASLGWIGPDVEEIIVYNRTGSACAVGDVEMLDHTRLATESTGNTLGGTGAAGIENAVVPTYDATTDTWQIFAGIAGVVMVGAADNAKMRLRLRGYIPLVAVDATVVLRTSVCVIGDGTEAAHVATIRTCATDAAMARKVIFLPLTARTGAGTTDGFFDGIAGFGSILSETDLS